jgi:hypothetical protein
MVELTLTHNGHHWVAKNAVLAADAATLEELDREVLRQLKQNGLLPAGEKLSVFMAFDNSTIPQWIRQYAQHYFNRVVELSG